MSNKVENRITSGGSSYVLYQEVVVQTIAKQLSNISISYHSGDLVANVKSGS